MSPPDAAEFLPFFTYYTAAGGVGGVFDGDYGVGSFWVLTSETGLDYQRVGFGGSLSGTFVPAE